MNFYMTYGGTNWGYAIQQVVLSNVLTKQVRNLGQSGYTSYGSFSIIPSTPLLSKLASATLDYGAASVLAVI